MIVYRVAQGKGWTKDTYAQVSTLNVRQGGNAIQLSNFSGTLRAGQSETAFADDGVKSVGSGIHVAQEVYTTKERSYSGDRV